MPHLELSLLGSFQVTLDGKPITTFRSVKTQALLAYLAVEAGHAHPRELLAGLLWPEEPDRTARQNLRQTLYYLRQALGGDSFLTTSSRAVQFDAHSDYWLDASTFLQDLESGQLEAAVELYRGDLLAGLFVKDSVSFEEWALVTRERLHRLALDALHLLTRQKMEQGEYQAAQEYAARQLALEPWREEAHRQLMQTLALRGQRSAALTQYDTCRRVLAEEMGIEPDAETTALYERIRDGVFAGPSWAETEPQRLGVATAHNLPPQPTSFVGREKELRHLLARLAAPDCRLLTLTGIGGIGKTRLAVQAASQLVGAPLSGPITGTHFAHGIFFVPCAGIAAGESESTFAATIAAALNLVLREDAAPKEQLFGYLGGKEMLLVLDNLEHLLPCASLVGEMLAAAPGVKVLATSREPLQLQEEHLYPLEGLEVPPAGSDAEIDAYSSVRLFVQQARRVQPHFALDEANRPDVAHICRYVDGVPLGVELAASWLRGLTCAEIATEMGRLDFFTTPLRDVPARHRSLRAVFEHSWRLLSPQEQDMLARLSIFRGGFQLEAAQAVAGVTLLDLTTLIARSLLQRTPGGRYILHELLRQFAAEKLAAQSEIESRAQAAHGLCYLEFLAKREQALLGQAAPATGLDRLEQSRQVQAVADLEVEVDNVRLAWQWATAEAAGHWTERLAAITKSLKSLYLFYLRQRWYAEGEVAFGQASAALQELGSEKAWQAQAMAMQAHCVAVSAQREKARKAMLRSEALVQDVDKQSGLAFTYLALGMAAYGLQAYEEGVRLQRRCLTLSSPDERWVQARAYHILAVMDNKRGAFVDAWQKMQTCLALQRQLDDPSNLAAALSLLGYVGAFLHKAEAVDHLRESLALHQALNNLPGMANALVYLGIIMVHQGLYPQAEEYCRQSLQFSRQAGDVVTLCLSLSNLCLVLVGQGGYEEILELSSKGLALDEGGQDLKSSLMGSRAYAEVKLGLDEALAQPHLQAALGLAQQIRYPLAMFLPLCGLGELAWRRGEYEAAWQCYRQALSAAQTMGATFFTLGVLVWLARLQAQMGDVVQALEWLALVLEHPVTPPVERCIAAEAWDEIAAGLPPAEVAAARERGKGQGLAQVVALFD